MGPPLGSWRVRGALPDGFSRLVPTPPDWKQAPDDQWERLCMSRTRDQALRVMQGMVLAGADPHPVLKATQEDHPDADLT